MEQPANSECDQERLTAVGEACLLATVLVLFATLWQMRHQPALAADSLIYHMAIPAMWVQQGFLTAIELPFHDAAAENAPMLTQMLGYVLIQLTGGDHFAWLIQPLFVAGMLVAFYRSLRLVSGDSGPAAAATACLCLFAPFIASMQICHNELALACGAAWTLHGLLEVRTRPDRGMVTTAFGLALMGLTKTVAVVYIAATVIVLLPVLASGRIWTALKEKPQAIVLCAVLLTMGASFFIRNVFIFGNPFYPSSVVLAGVSLFDGLYDSSAMRNHQWQLAVLFRMLVYDAGPFSMAPPASVYLWSGFVVAIGGLIRYRRESEIRDPLAVCVGFVVTAILLYFATTPFWKQHRLLFPVYYGLWLTTGVVVALLWRRKPAWRKRALLCVIVALAVAVLEHVLFLNVYMYVAVAIAWGFVRWRQRLIGCPRRVVITVAAVLLVGGLALSTLAYPGYRAKRETVRTVFYLEQYDALGTAWVALQELTQGGASVAYAGTPLLYPLFGAQLQNQLHYVPISSSDIRQAPDMDSGEAVYEALINTRRQKIDDQFWLAGLEAADVDFLFLVDTTTRGGAKHELSAIQRHRQQFRVRFANSGIYIIERKRP